MKNRAADGTITGLACVLSFLQVSLNTSESTILKNGCDIF
jgi:hypothetical protein